MSLHVLMQGVPMGTLRQDAHGNPHFAYTPEWQNAAGAFPLSLCLSLSAATHAPGAVAAQAPSSSLRPNALKRSSQARPMASRP